MLTLILSLTLAQLPNPFDDDYIPGTDLCIDWKPLKVFQNCTNSNILNFQVTDNCAESLELCTLNGLPLSNCEVNIGCIFYNDLKIQESRKLWNTNRAGLITLCVLSPFILAIGLILIYILDLHVLDFLFGPIDDDFVIFDKISIYTSFVVYITGSIVCMIYGFAFKDPFSSIYVPYKSESLGNFLCTFTLWGIFASVLCGLLMNFLSQLFS